VLSFGRNAGGTMVEYFNKTAFGLYWHGRWLSSLYSENGKNGGGTAFVIRLSREDGELQYCSSQMYSTIQLLTIGDIVCDCKTSSNKIPRQGLCFIAEIDSTRSGLI
jgi:hypothetical protein